MDSILFAIFQFFYFGVCLRVWRPEHSNVHKNVNAAATTAQARPGRPHENMPLGLNCQSGFDPSLAWIGLGSVLKLDTVAAPCCLCRSRARTLLWPAHKSVSGAGGFVVFLSHGMLLGGGAAAAAAAAW